MTRPLVSVIVPTKNSAAYLERCLRSIRSQSYRPVEIIVVDNGSVDETRRIAAELADAVYVWGPERSAQVNFGVEKAAGEFVFRVDSDFVLDPEVVGQCVQRASEGFDAIVVHNSPDVSAGWIARIRKFEVDMYKYDLDHSAARFFRIEVFRDLGGFNERLVAGEDYDIQNRLNRSGKRVGFIDAEATHLAEPRRLGPHLRKYFYYGRDFVKFRRANRTESRTQLAIFRRVYARNWRRFVAHPILGMGFILYTIAKFSSGAAGYALESVKLGLARSSSP